MNGSVAASAVYLGHKRMSRDKEWPSGLVDKCASFNLSRRMMKFFKTSLSGRKQSDRLLLEREGEFISVARSLKFCLLFFRNEWVSKPE